MEAQEKIILTYVKHDGSAPFNDWLQALKDRKARAIIRTRINRIRLGNLGDCKSVFYCLVAIKAARIKI